MQCFSVLSVILAAGLEFFIAQQFTGTITTACLDLKTRVAELGSLSSGAKMAMKIFVKRVFTIFASNASFLRVIANLQN